MDEVEGRHFIVISIAADLSVPDSSNAFRHSVSDSIQNTPSQYHAGMMSMINFNTLPEHSESTDLQQGGSSSKTESRSRVNGSGVRISQM